MNNANFKEVILDVTAKYWPKKIKYFNDLKTVDQDELIVSAVLGIQDNFCEFISDSPEFATYMHGFLGGAESQDKGIALREFILKGFKKRAEESVDEILEEERRIDAIEEINHWGHSMMSNDSGIDSYADRRGV